MPFKTVQSQVNLFEDLLREWSKDKLHRCLKQPIAAIGWPGTMEMKERFRNSLITAIERGQIIELGEMSYPESKKASLNGWRLTMGGHIKTPFRTPWIVSGHIALLPDDPKQGTLVLIDPVSDREWLFYELCLTRQNMIFAWYVAALDPITTRVTSIADAQGMDLLKAGYDNAARAYAAGANAAMTAVAILNTRGVDWKSYPRLTDRKGRVTRVGYHVTNRDYFTALRGDPKAARGPRGPLEKERASPIPHIRRGHERRIEGRAEPIWINDMLINVKSEGELSFFERFGYKNQRGKVAFDA